MRDFNLEDRKEDREVFLENVRSIEVLEKTKRILLIDNTDFMTVQMVADYYEVEKNTIEVLINRNREELKENGLNTISGINLKEMFEKHNMIIVGCRGYFECCGMRFSNKINTIINKRVLLNIGMLLRDSLVARELRKRLLDVIEDSEEGKGSIDQVVQELDVETKLKIEYVDAMMNGNITKMNEVNAKLFELKSKRIAELEDKIEEIVDTNISYENARRELVANIKGISTLKHNSNFTKTWGEFYKFLLDNGYNLELRRTNKKKKIVSDMDELDVDLSIVSTNIYDKKEERKSYKRNTDEYKKISASIKTLEEKFKEIKKQYKTLLTQFNHIDDCSKMDLLLEEEFKDIVVLTRSWSLASNYDWKSKLS